MFSKLAGACVGGTIHFVCIDWRHIGEIVAAGTEAYTEVKNLCVWAKTNGGMGSLYRSQHELVFVFNPGTAPHINGDSPLFVIVRKALDTVKKIIKNASSNVGRQLTATSVPASDRIVRDQQFNHWSARDPSFSHIV